MKKLFKFLDKFYFLTKVKAQFVIMTTIFLLIGFWISRLF